MARYFGLKTKRNKVLWLLVLLLTLISMAGLCLNVLEGRKCQKGLDKLPESDGVTLLRGAAITS
jgi:hypothetical protein